MFNPEDLALYQSARARRRSEVRRQARAETGLNSAATYVGYNADREAHQFLVGEQIVEGDGLTTGGLAPGDRAEAGRGFLDATPRPGRGSERRRRRRPLQSFVAAVFFAEYQFGPRVAAYEGTLYANYQTWIGFKEAGRDLQLLKMPWRGGPVFSTNPDFPIDTIVAFNGSMGGLRGGYACSILYVSRNIRILQIATSILSPVVESLADYPVRITRQTGESPEAAVLTEEWGFFSTLYTIKLVGASIERLEATRDIYLPTGQAVVYSDWWEPYLPHLYKGVNYAPGESNFPDYDARDLEPGGQKFIYKTKVYTIRKPRELIDLRRPKRLLLPNSYQVDSNKPIDLFIDTSEFHIPNSSDLRLSYLASSALEPFNDWLPATTTESGGSLLFYERPRSGGPINVDRFWTFEFGEIKFFGFAF